MPRSNAVSLCLRTLACVAILALDAGAGLAASSAPAAAADSSRATVSRPAQAPTSAAQMGIAPRRSNRRWLYGGLALAIVGGVVIAAGGGGSTSPAPTPIGPPPPPPVN